MEFSEDLDGISLEGVLKDIIAFGRGLENISYRGIHSQEELEQETTRMYPELRKVCGKPARSRARGGFMGGLETKIFDKVGAMGWSWDFSSVSPDLVAALQYIGFVPLRFHPSQMSSEDEEVPFHGVLAHELAHCSGSNEAATMLRGVELNARLALQGDDNHRHGCYTMLRYMACRTAALKAIYEEREEELLALADKRGGPELREELSSKIEGMKRGATHGVYYEMWTYCALPYKSLMLSIGKGSEYVKVPQPPQPTKEAWMDSAFAILRAIMGVAEELPVNMSATIALYYEVTERSNNAAHGIL